MKPHSREHREPTPARAINAPPVLGPMHRKALMSLALSGAYSGNGNACTFYPASLIGMKITSRLMSGLVNMGYAKVTGRLSVGIWTATITPAGRNAIGVE